MSESDELHKLSESVYRHLEKTFSPGLRNVIATGKAYHESLSNITSSATAYIESLLKLGHSCKTTCKGNTQTIGEALFAIADTYRQIQVQVEEANKALWTEFLLPLENKVESQFKEIAQGHKRYVQGHKAVYGTYEKAQNSLKKARKKSKSKHSFDNHEEVEKLKEWDEKLGKFRAQGLKLALLEERKHYCYLLDKCCTIVKINADNHIRAGTMLGRPLSTWLVLCSNPMILPPESASLITTHLPPNVNLSPIHNGHVMTSSKKVEYSQQMAMYPYMSNAPDNVIQEGDEEQNDILKAVTVPPPTSRSPQVRAIYSHNAEGDNQLTFSEGEVIVLIGDKSDGWHYGLNMTSNRYGWFPLSFVELMDNHEEVQPSLSISTRQRHKSVGDLRDTMESDLSDPRYVRRPLSLYGPAMIPRHHESGDNTGSDTYQEPGVTTMGDGQPDFWARGVQNNSRYKLMPHADYDDDPGYRSRASMMSGLSAHSRP